MLCAIFHMHHGIKGMKYTHALLKIHKIKKHMHDANMHKFNILRDDRKLIQKTKETQNK